MTNAGLSSYVALGSEIGRGRPS